MEALARGETIQAFCGRGSEGVSVWLDQSDPDFSYAPDKYRIKPKPLEAWVTIIAETGILSAVYATEAKAKEARRFSGRRFIHMREVIP